MLFRINILDSKFRRMVTTIFVEFPEDSNLRV